MTDFPSRDPGVFTRPGSASIRPSAITDAVYELAVRVESLEGGGGEPGPIGPQGEQGEPGETGATGPQGETGATGPQGPPGPQGEIGATGAQGTTGPAGATGATGPQGPAGLGMNIKGTVPTYSALPAQPQPANDAYTTVDTGHMWVSNGTAWIDAGLIQGPQGPAGPQGVQGATGATGATGAQGIQGVKGDTGATGSQGPQGVKGDTGAQGVQGPIGTTGAQGPAGPGVPVGGTTSQVLTKTGAGDYATAWQTPAVMTIPPEYVTDSELATALAPYATDADLANHVAAADPHSVYATDAEVAAAVAAHAGAADPHAVYLLTSEGDARYATPANITSAITAHEGLANPHAIYLTQAEADAIYVPVAHTSAPDPHPVYLTQSEGDGRYTQGGQTQAQADARYLQLTGGTLSGDLILSEATPLLSLKQAADTQPRARLTDLGLYFGPGGATVLDTSLLRTGANALSLGGSPVITQTLGDARYATPANITSAITTHEGLANPHPTYTTDAEVATAISTHAGLADPHPVYSTAAEVTTAITAHEALANPHAVYALDTDLSTHAAAADPHPTYSTAAEVTAAITAHEGLANPHGIYLTQAEADALYAATAHAHATLYVPLAGGSVMVGALGPTTTNTRDLGTTALRWRKAWAVDIETTNVPTINGVSMDSRYALASALTALTTRVAALEAQMGAGVNGHYHLMGTWRQTQKATLPSTLLVREEAPAT